MYQSTDRLVSNEPGASTYQSVEGGAGSGTTGNEVPDVPQTFLSQVKKAREENIGCCNFCMAFFALLLGSILWTIILIVIIAVPIVMIVIGAEYFNECPIQKMIPISLLVAGCVLMLSNVLNFVERFRRFSDSSMPKSHTVIGWINVFINLFLLAWFVATTTLCRNIISRINRNNYFVSKKSRREVCYWVYSAKPEFGDNVSNSNAYCNPHLYGFVYWLLNFIFIFFGTMVVVCGLVMCIAMLVW